MISLQLDPNRSAQKPVAVEPALQVKWMQRPVDVRQPELDQQSDPHEVVGIGVGSGVGYNGKGVGKAVGQGVGRRVGGGVSGVVGVLVGIGVGRGVGTLKSRIRTQMLCLVVPW